MVKNPTRYDTTTDVGLIPFEKRPNINELKGQQKCNGPLTKQFQVETT